MLLYSFLKTMILPALEGQQTIRTFVQPHSGAHPPPDTSNLRPVKRAQRTALAQEFVWKVIPPEERQKDPTVAKGKRRVDVGVSEDISHLNKRRQNARVRKIAEASFKPRGNLPFRKS